MKGPAILEAHADVLRTRVGAAFPGSRAVFRGHDLHKELMGTSWLGLCAFGILGRHASEAQLTFITTAWVSSSYPDTRLWNNRVAALAGTARSTPNLALSAAQAISEASIYGRGNEFRALDFFIKTRKALDAGITLADHIEGFLGQGGRMPGYGRPISNSDERMPIVLGKARELGLADGPFLALAFELDRYFEHTRRPLRMNLSAMMSAFAGDFGWTPREFNMMLFCAFLAGVSPCYLEAVDKPAGALMPVRCADVRYEGVAQRDWPRS